MFGPETGAGCVDIDFLREFLGLFQGFCCVFKVILGCFVVICGF